MLLFHKVSSIVTPIGLNRTESEEVERWNNFSHFFLTYLSGNRWVNRILHMCDKSNLRYQNLGTIK